jgi:hypothetical protein
MNMRTIIDEIHSRVAAENSIDSDPLAPVSGGSSVTEDLPLLYSTCSRAAETAQRIGLLPPSPRTLRGRASRVLVKAVQRMLFWYTPAVADSQREAAVALQLCYQLIQQQQKAISGLQN